MIFGFIDHLMQLCDYISKVRKVCRSGKMNMKLVIILMSSVVSKQFSGIQDERSLNNKACFVFNY